jgi:hypothetical protein
MLTLTVAIVVRQFGVLWQQVRSSVLPLPVPQYMLLLPCMLLHNQFILKQYIPKLKVAHMAPTRPILP